MRQVEKRVLAKIRKKKTGKSQRGAESVHIQTNSDTKSKLLDVLKACKHKSTGLRETHNASSPLSPEKTRNNREGIAKTRLWPTVAKQTDFAGGSHS